MADNKIAVDFTDKNYSETDEFKSFTEFCEMEVKYKNGEPEDKEGIQIKGKDLLFLNAPLIWLDRLGFGLIGDGLYFFGGDLFCAYELLSTTVNEDSVEFEYEKYTVTVSWENEGEKRTNPKLERKYK